MTSHKNAGGIGINWLIFGSNHHEKKPEGGVLENFTMCAEKDFFENRHIKTICDPLKVLSYIVHFPIYYAGFHNLNENGEIISSGNRTKEVHFDKIRINHYFSKSREEYIAKKNRGRADLSAVRTMGDFHHFDQNVLQETEILSRL